MNDSLGKYNSTEHSTKESWDAMQEDVSVAHRVFHCKNLNPVHNKQPKNLNSVHNQQTTQEPELGSHLCVVSQ